MVKTYKFGAMRYEKWMQQNDGEVIDIVEGCLLDSLMVNTRRGVALLMETYINSNSSNYTLYFAAKNDRNAIDTLFDMWDAFAGAAIVDVSGGVA